MRRAIALLVALALVLASLPALAEGFGSPCEDPLFQELKKKPLEQMTEREFQYFMQKDRECSQGVAGRMAQGGLAEARPGDGWHGPMGHRPHGHKTLLWVAAGVLVAGAATTAVLLADQHHHRFGGQPVPMDGH